MITLNFAPRLRDILLGRRLIHLVEPDQLLRRDGLSRKIEHQEHLATALWTGKRRWWFNHCHHLVSSS